MGDVHLGDTGGGIPRAADRFSPGHFDADEWAQLACGAGMRYMVMTTKHHDGFCLFDTRTTDFCSTKTAAGRDFVREYVDACRRHGLKVGLYFSVKDWQYPGYFRGPEKTRRAGRSSCGSTRRSCASC